MAVPSMYAAMARLKSVQPDQFSHVKISASGGEPLPDTVYEEVQEKLGLTLIQGYGLTETSPIIAVDLPWAHRRGTVGPPLPGVEVRICDVEDQPVKQGEEGEIQVRGPLVMKGYYNQPDQTASVLDSEGWFHTGDLGQFDEAGYLRITGRMKDLIIVGGDNVYPREVEAVLEQHPAVSEAAVIGMSDGSRGEVVVGFVCLHEDGEAAPDEIRGFCRGKLANYKIPRQIMIRSDLPRGPTGKILRRRLVEDLNG
jgi:long-chain acyl-CoA synthetase